MNTVQTIEFQPYTPSDEGACLSLFDENCPQYFAVNERNDYQAFLSDKPQGYYIAYHQAQPVAAFGFRVYETENIGAINWIMVAQENHGLGIGSQMMDFALELAKSSKVASIEIAASHLSAPFFARFGAQKLDFIEDGWGNGMHRVDMILQLES